jgi:serine/threonine protein kinase
MQRYSHHISGKSIKNLTTKVDFPLEKLLGSGTFGQVFQSSEGRIIKFIRSISASSKKQLEEEVALQMKLYEKEPDVCPRLYEYGRTVGGVYVIVMEQCEGTALSILKNEEVVLDYMFQVATILQRLEKYQFNHRDLKSDNVMYKTQPDGKRKFLLIDFGFACGTFDGVQYQGTMYHPPTTPCFRRSRDLAMLAYEALPNVKGDMRVFLQLVLTFDYKGKRCDMSQGCPPEFRDWNDIYDFTNKSNVENPNTTPEGLLKAIASYRQGGLESCAKGFVVHPVTETCEKIPSKPVEDALKPATTPKPHIASPAVVKPATLPKPPTPAVVKPATMKPCPEGKERNPETGRCRKKQVRKTRRNCPEGKELNPETGRCVEKCPPGKVRNPATRRCVKQR